MQYVRNVVKEYLVTCDWSTQDSLVPVLGTVLGFTDGEIRAIRTKRASLQPLSMRVGGWVRVMSDAAAAANGANGKGGLKS